MSVLRFVKYDLDSPGLPRYLYPVMGYCPSSGHSLLFLRFILMSIDGEGNNPRYTPTTAEYGSRVFRLKSAFQFHSIYPAVGAIICRIISQKHRSTIPFVPCPT